MDVNLTHYDERLTMECYAYFGGFSAATGVCLATNGQDAILSAVQYDCDSWGTNVLPKEQVYYPHV